MVRIRVLVAVLLAAMTIVIPCASRAADATQAEIDALQKDIETLRKQLRDSQAGGVRSTVETAMTNKFGPQASVTTRYGKLTMGGLIQVWYYGIQHDHRGLFDNPGGATAIFDSNDALDNNSFRVRYAELSFKTEIHENISAYVMIDPAREATSFPDLPQQQGLFKRANQVAPEFDNANGPGLGDTTSIASVQQGSGAVPRMLQDAYINYHGVIPHHDFTIGQFLPRFGEEGVRSDGQLDFAERSFVGKLGNIRDLGIQAHGSWFEGCDSDEGDGRLQYWLGAFDGAGNYYESAGQQQNRADDNNQKDFLGAIMVRPLWNNNTCDACDHWGRMELGAAVEAGTHGKSGHLDPINDPVNGLNRPLTSANRVDAYASYEAGGAARGLWVRGEWMRIHDRNAPGTVVDLTGAGGTDMGNIGSGSGLAQSDGRPFSSQGFYAAIGYKLSDSKFAGCSMPGWLQPFEFDFRFDTFQNVEVADPANPQKTRVFRTQIYTGGINYYIKGHNAKIQANCNFLVNPVGDPNTGITFHNVKNDNFIISFQVAF